MNLLTAVRAAARLTDPPLQIASPWSSPATLESIVWPEIFGMDTAPLTRSEAMSVPAVKRSRLLVAGPIAAMPLIATDDDGNPTTTPRWLTRTDEPVSAYHRMLWTVDDLFFHGWSLWAVERGSQGTIRHAHRIRWDRWSFNSDGQIEVDEHTVDRDSVILIPGVDDGLLCDGTRAVRHASLLLAASDRAAETPTANLELHQNNDRPMSDPDIAKLVSSWAAARRGKNGGVAYTNSAIDVREHGSMDGHLLVEGRNAAAVDVARAAGIPAAMIDATAAGDSLTYSTTASRNRELVAYGLAPFMAAIAARLSLDDVTAHGTRVAFDTSQFTAEPATPADPPTAPGAATLPDPPPPSGGSGTTTQEVSP